MSSTSGFAECQPPLDRSPTHVRRLGSAWPLALLLAGRRSARRHRANLPADLATSTIWSRSMAVPRCCVGRPAGSCRLGPMTWRANIVFCLPCGGLIRWRRGRCICALIPECSASSAIPSRLASRAEIGGMLSRQLVGSLAALHAVTPEAIALDKLGRPAGFLGRTLEGWAVRGVAFTDPANRCALAVALTVQLRTPPNPGRRLNWYVRLSCWGAATPNSASAA
jgi:hypothetical protein